MSVWELIFQSVSVALNCGLAITLIKRKWQKDDERVAGLTAVQLAQIQSEDTGEARLWGEIKRRDITIKELTERYATAATAAALNEFQYRHVSAVLDDAKQVNAEVLQEILERLEKIEASLDAALKDSPQRPSA